MDCPKIGNVSDFGAATTLNYVALMPDLLTLGQPVPFPRPRLLAQIVTDYIDPIAPWLFLSYETSSHS